LVLHDDEPIFEKIEMHKSAQLTYVLYPTMLLRLGPIEAHLGHVNQFRVEMIDYICRKHSIQFNLGAGSAKSKLLSRLCNSHSHHVKTFERNVALCVEKLLLQDNNEAKDPYYSWVLVRV